MACPIIIAVQSLAGRRVTVIGLGQVGMRLARHLAGSGAILTVTDIDPGHRRAADELGARWVEPAAAATMPADVLVPAALGGLLDHDVVPRLRCAAVVGPANNQLADETVADDLAARGIVWAPDFVVNAGGVIHGTIIDIDGGTRAEAEAATRDIGPRLTDILHQAEETDRTPYAVAVDLARRRVNAAGTKRS